MSGGGVFQEPPPHLPSTTSQSASSSSCADRKEYLLKQIVLLQENKMQLQEEMCSNLEMERVMDSIQSERAALQAQQAMMRQMLLASTVRSSMQMQQMASAAYSSLSTMQKSQRQLQEDRDRTMAKLQQVYKAYEKEIERGMTAAYKDKKVQEKKLQLMEEREVLRMKKNRRDLEKEEEAHRREVAEGRRMHAGIEEGKETFDTKPPRWDATDGWDEVKILKR